MNDSQVDLANFGQVVVNQPDAGVAIARLQKDFFSDLTPHAFEIRRPPGLFVNRRDVSTDADRPLAQQSRFPLPFAAAVMKKLLTATKETVRNELLEADVVLHFVARPVARVRGIEQRLQIPI